MATEQQMPRRTGLLEFIRSSMGCQFVIPVYQRNYTWTAGREVKQYLEDLNSVLSNEYPKYFLGIMIYLENPIDYSTREFSVIDGQQRLTTTFLTLYAIKSILSENNLQNDINILEGQYLTNPFATEKSKFKLKPLVSDDEVYKHIVTDELNSLEDKSSNVYKNYIYIQSFVKEKMNDGYSVNDILMAMDRLYIVCIPVSKEDNAQKIFESINATGVKLRASDLIRNFVLMDLSSDEQEVLYTKYWKKLEDLLSSDAKKLESFFRFFLAAKNKALPNSNMIYSEFVIWFKTQMESNSIEQVLREIVDYADSFNILYRKDINKINSVLKGNIIEYRKILSDMPAPLLLEFFNLHKKNENEDRGFTIEQLNMTIGLVNTYLIRRAICDLDTSSISRLFPALLKDTLNDCDERYDNVVELLKKNLVNKNKGNAMYLPDDKQLYNLVINANMYNIRSTLRIFLDKLEHHDNSAPVDLSVLSIEHLMPQTPTKEWYDELKVDADEYLRNLNRLGNLTFATKSDNSAMKNNIWEYKNKVLKGTSHIKINEKILGVKQWNISNIDSRTIELINKINELFPYMSASADVVIKKEIYLSNAKIQATGFLYVDNGSVEINEGSQLYDFENAENYPEIEDARQELIEEGIIAETDNGLYFTKQYIFYPKQSNSTALSTSASVILHGSRNGWEYWQDINQKPLNENKELKKKYSKQEVKASV